jgi:topoisomerase IV subunit A
MTQNLNGGEIRDADMGIALGERYLSYALSTIMARSLPDVRDGLKPVHRRLLFAMRELGLDPASGYKKAARVVGDVIGKFHPHGEIAVYEALVRLAQDFAVRYPLVDGQGNFGNIDGDNAAAMRYTEARLTQVAQALLQGIDEDAVDFRQTYDGDNSEPLVLPGAFPNLLANGAAGIAVGMATSIPPHNADELCAALKHLLQRPDASVADLLAFVEGPDFPTGGVVVEPRESIAQAYETGRGSFRLRARWSVEPLKNGVWQIVVTEIPYQVPKSRLIERVADLLSEKKLGLLADIRDESTEDVRLVLEPKSRTVDPAVLMESLFRQTDLESRFSLNMNVLDRDCVPRVMNLKDVLVAFLDHRREVLIRRSNHRLGVIDRRLDMLAGYLVVYLNVDAVIRIIREEDEPKPVLMESFALNDGQAEAILNMRLRALRRLDEMTIRKEFEALSAEREALNTLVADPKRQSKALGKEIDDIAKRFGKATALGARRTTFAAPPLSVVAPIESMIEREDVTVIASEKGWVRALKGHDVDVGEIKYKDGDGPRFLVKAATTDKLLVLATDGKFYTLGVDKLPRGRGFGEPLRLMIDLGQDHDVASLRLHRPGGRLLVASSDGRGFQVEEADVLAQTRAGKQVLLPADGAKAFVALAVDPASGADHVAIVGENRKLLLFKLDEAPRMARGRGVMLQRYGDGGMSDIALMAISGGLSFPFGSKTRTVTDLTPWIGKRASGGRLAPVGFPRNNRFAG